MRKHLISILTLFLFLSVSFYAFSETVTSVSEESSILEKYFSLIPDSDIQTLKRDNELTLFLEKNQPPVYLPLVDERVDISSNIKKNQFQHRNRNSFSS